MRERIVAVIDSALIESPRQLRSGCSLPHALGSIVGMDYDKSEIATVYDEARSLSPERLRLWLELVARDARPVSGSLIVDLGCGTGRFSAPIADHFGARVVGVDPSLKMLETARHKLRSDRVSFTQASAYALPFTDGTVDTVFISMVFHHFSDPAGAAKECRRVLRHEGRVCVRNTMRESDFPYRHFFPAMRPLIETELPTRNDLINNFNRAGFTLAVHEIVRQVVADDWPSFVQKSSLRADSFLSRLSDQDFNAGMEALRDHAAGTAQGETVVEDLDWFVFSA